MISFSKSSYIQKYPDHITLFNANIFTQSEGKVWYGDLDLTLDGDCLVKIAREANCALYVLREMDGRFENEKIDSKLLKDIAVATYDP